MRTRTVRNLALAPLFSLAMAACTAAIAAPPPDSEVDRDVLPITIEKVWYRTRKVRLFGRAYEKSGQIQKNHVELRLFELDQRVIKARRMHHLWSGTRVSRQASLHEPGVRNFILYQ